MGHKFCNKCGEKYHENGKCKEEENIDKLFEEYSRRYNLKNCPYCHIVVIKNGGCNHMNCKYCGKHWCWLCNEIFNSTEEHYGNINSKCYNQMMNNNHERYICSKCDSEIIDNGIRGFDCDHLICHNCYINHLLETETMILFPEKIIKCIVIGCNKYKIIRGNWFIRFVNEKNNQNLIKKYKNSFLLYEYTLYYIFTAYSYFNIIFSFFECLEVYLVGSINMNY
jgi:hypothetical protein